MLVHPGVARKVFFTAGTKHLCNSHVRPGSAAPLCGTPPSRHSRNPACSNGFCLVQETHGNRSTDSARGNPGWGSRHALLAAQPYPHAKQLLNIVGKQTMLEQTVARLRP